jgi:putative Mn2+ efflux pump MntP
VIVLNIIDLLLLALGLSMDAFAVSICKGLSLGRIRWKHMLIAGSWFGGFQFLMPVIGYYAGRLFTDFIASYNHWISFLILAAIGINMIWESFGKTESCDANMSLVPMFMLAVATSIDALAVGVTFAFMDIAILPSALTIGVTTFICSAGGVKTGSLFGMKYKTGAVRLGGTVLIILGLKILLEGVGIL